MYVRWKKRVMTRRHCPTGKTALTAVLVENRRVDGKPRQRLVSYLGTIRQDGLTSPYHQLGFWGTADRHLAALALDNATRERIERSLLGVVPRPTHEALQRGQEHLRQLVAGVNRQ